MHTHPASSLVTNTSLIGRFNTRIEHLCCTLDLHLDANGRVFGQFCADGETLTLQGGPPDESGEVQGLLREVTTGEALAAFRLRLHARGVIFEVSVWNPEIKS